MKAEGILMHREQNIIAVRAATGDNCVVQVFDIAAGKKIKNCEIKEKCAFWRWIGLNKLAVVGTTGVYHIDTSNEASQPVKVFDRIPQMAKCQIMSYDVDATETWCYLIGLYSDEQRNINSQIQLYNIEKKQTMPLEGYSACFADMPVTDGNNSYKNGLFCFCEKKASEQIQRLHITEIGNPAPGAQKFKINTEIQMAPDAPGDFPLLMQSSPKFGLIFIITKFGYFYMYEASKAALVYRQRITDQLVVVATRNTATDGMICINKAGQVLALNVEENNLVKYVMNAQHIPDQKNVAFKMAARFSLPGADDVFLAQFNQCMLTNDFAGAARCARDAPGTLVRNATTIDKFKSLQPQPGQQ